MKSSKRKICQAVVLAFSAMAASAAMAQTVPNILGGGSSLIAPTINTEIGDFGTTIGNMTYETFSSGVGQSAFLNNDPTQFGLASTAGPVNFANSDAALTTAQVSTNGTYVRSATDGLLIQLPYAVTPITIPYTQAPAGVPATLVLNDFDLCGIFSGKITSWNQIQNPDNSNALFTSTAPISVAYRSDNSGTSDLLTRHLQAVCTTGTNGNSNVAFKESQSFASNFSGSIPTSFISASGSGGVAAVVVAAKTGSAGTVFAYLSPDYTNTTLATQSTSASANQLTVASLRNSHTGTDIVPTGAEATMALGAVLPPVSTGLAGRTNVINPFNWVPGAVLGSAAWTAIADPVSGYPISGTTNIIVSQCYANSASVTAVKDFLNDHYTNSTFKAVLTGNGFDTVPATYVTAITNDILTSNTNHTDIGDTATNACGATGVVGR